MLEKRTKIALVINSMDNSGGMERVMSQLANFFVTNPTIEVHLIIFLKSGKFYKISSKVILHEPDFYYKNYNRFFYTLKTAYFVRKSINKINPTAVLSFGEKYNIFVLTSLLFSDHNIFISDRCSPFNNITYLQKLLRPILYRTAKGLISQTEIAKDILFSYTKHTNIVVIPNPIKFFENFKDIKRENIIINVGRLVKSKQQDKLIRYFAEINNLNWRLVFVGDGDLKSSYIGLAKELGIESKVEFISSTPNLGYLLAKSKIFAFTSRSEGFPNVLGEALFIPIACISFNCVAGPSQLISDGENGYLVELNNGQEYKRKLTDLMNNTDLREKFELEALKRKQYFSLENIGRMYWETLIEN